MFVLKVRRVGNSAAITLPKEALARLRVSEGERIDALRADYAAMEIMFFGARPEFEVLLDELLRLEQVINDVHS